MTDPETTNDAHCSAAIKTEHAGAVGPGDADNASPGGAVAGETVGTPELDTAEVECVSAARGAATNDEAATGAPVTGMAIATAVPHPASRPRRPSRPCANCNAASTLCDP
jgi:hypothetical protein